MSMNDREKRYISMLNRKHEHMKEVLRLTRGTSLTGAEEDISKYIELMEKREDIMRQMKEIDDNLSASVYTKIWQGGDGGFRKDAELIRDEIKSLAGQIVDLDNQMSKEIPRMRAEIKKNLKEAANTRNINTAYQNHYLYGVQSSFDKSN